MPVTVTRPSATSADIFLGNGDRGTEFLGTEDGVRVTNVNLGGVDLSVEEVNTLITALQELVS